MDSNQNGRKQHNTFNIRLNEWEHNQLTMLADKTNQSKAEVLKQSLYYDSPELRMLRKTVYDGILKSNSKLGENDINGAREELHKVCLTLNLFQAN